MRLDAVGQRADEVQVGELVREAAVLARHRPQRAPPLAAADERVEGVLDLAHQIRHRARERERLCREAGGRRRPQRRRRLVARRRARIVARRACRRRRRRLGRSCARLKGARCTGTRLSLPNSLLNASLRPFSTAQRSESGTSSHEQLSRTRR